MEASAFSDQSYGEASYSFCETYIWKPILLDKYNFLSNKTKHELFKFLDAENLTGDGEKFDIYILSDIILCRRSFLEVFGQVWRI